MKKTTIFICLLAALTSNAEEVQTLRDVTKSYLGSRYGENTIKCNADFEPIRKSAETVFDCVTFVEYSFAKYEALRKKEKQEHVLAGLRYYDSVQDCIHRKHFFVADWLATNELASPVSAEIADKLGIKVATKATVIDREDWFYKVHDIEYTIDKEIINIDYIPFDALAEADPAAFAEDALMLVVNTNEALDISHVGFLFKIDGKLILRHASTVDRSVVDEDFFGYIRKYGTRRDLLGLAFWEIL